MRVTAWRAAAPLLIAAVISCGRDGTSAKAKPGDDLRRDLAAASAASVELATDAQSYQATRVVSDLEQSERAVPVTRAPVPRPQVQRHSDVAPQQEKAPDPSPQVAVDAPTAPEPQQPEVATNDAPTVPTVAPRPSPVPVEYPAASGRQGEGAGADGRTGPGSGIGGIIGVIIRGGGIGGDDHCVPNTRGRPGWPALPHPNPIPMRGGRIIRPRVRR
jgi:hypothetical protein